MKLEPKAKPVRIRIKSGGEEHFSLESLKKNFSVDDLWEAVIGKSLSRWLKNQNENVLADKVDEFCKIQNPDDNQYVDFSKLFFEDGTITDSDSLINYYQNKELIKNLYYASKHLLLCLSYECGKSIYKSHRHYHKTENWISFFEKKLYQIHDDNDKEECLKFLIALYKDHGDKEKINYLQTELVPLLLKKVEIDDNGLDDLLMLGDYASIKMYFDKPDFKNKKDISFWISAFNECEKSLSGTQQGECQFVLYKLYLSNNKNDMALKYLTKSAKNCHPEAKRILAKQNYPELEDFLKQHPNIQPKKLDYIAAKWYQSYNKKGEHAYYYTVCYDCMLMVADIVLNIGYKYNTVGDIRNKRHQLIEKHSRYKDLVFLIAALACEERMDNAVLFRDPDTISLSFDFKVFAKAKIDGKGIIIMAENNQKCNTQTASPVQQMFFIMRTYGCIYAFDYIEDVN